MDMHTSNRFSIPVSVLFKFDSSAVGKNWEPYKEFPYNTRAPPLPPVLLILKLNATVSINILHLNTFKFSG